MTKTDAHIPGGDAPDLDTHYTEFRNAVARLGFPLVWQTVRHLYDATDSRAIEDMAQHLGTMYRILPINDTRIHTFLILLIESATLRDPATLSVLAAVLASQDNPTANKD